MTYHIKLNTIHGIDVYTVILVQGRKLVASSTHMSNGSCVNWAYKTHKKLILK